MYPPRVAQLSRGNRDLYALATLGQWIAGRVDNQAAWRGGGRRGNVLPGRPCLPLLALPDLNLRGSRDDRRREAPEDEVHDRDPVISKHRVLAAERPFSRSR